MRTLLIEEVFEGLKEHKDELHIEVTEEVFQLHTQLTEEV